MKNIKILFILLGFSFAAFAQEEEGPTAAPSINNFAVQPDIAGEVANSVNLFTGDVSFPVNLISLPGKNELNVSTVITYNSATIHKQVGVWNLESPTGILGLGWSMDMPRIIVDHKSTGSREDDTYYIVEGGMSNRLIGTGYGYEGGSYYGYATKNYQFWKIRYYYTDERWEITKENGVKYIYGDKNSTRSTLQYIVRWGNWIGNSSQTAGQTQMVSAWNLSEIVSLWGDKITYAYENVEEFVGSSSGKKHTEASYLKQVTDVLGRKIQFFYAEKSANFYMEPHTEKAEPDAYQEVFETRYLDHIDVLSETGSLYLAFQFSYGSIDPTTNMAKMLLTSITQKNPAGRSIPVYQFAYGTTDPTRGFLQTVTYPTGGSTSFTYTPSTIAHSNRKLTISAPAGYAEPKVWIENDYVVVAWRELASGGGHDSGPKTVKLYAYQWVGEWKEQFLQTISGVSLENTTYTTYKNFKVITQPKFFGVLTGGVSNNYYTLFIRHKSETDRGTWGSYTRTYDYGDGVADLVGGENFLFVGAFRDDGTHPSYRFTFQGNSWVETQVNQTIGDHYYTGTNNFFFSHNRAGVDGAPELNFHYLSEDRKWTIKSLDYSWLEFSSSSRSYWHPSNSYAVAMAGNNPEYIYQWDATYTNFMRHDVLGAFSDNSYVFNIANGLTGILQSGSPATGKPARYDGQNWVVSPNFSAYYQYRASFGDDYSIWTVDDRQRPVRGYLRKYNPNTMTWSDQDISYTPNETLFGNTYGHNAVRAGNNFFSFTDKIYFRKSNGTWSPDYALTAPAGTNIAASSIKVGDKFFVYRNTSGPVTVQFIKNGAISVTDNITGSYESLATNLVGANTIVTAPTSLNDASSLTLYRVQDGKANGTVTDYPVTRITVNDGTQNRYTTFEYNLSKAAIDPSGTVAQYNEVTTIPGSATVSAKPYGYTKTFFYNGLTSAELGVSFIPVELSFTGLPYETNTYDASNNLVSSVKVTYTSYAPSINNSDITKIEQGYYVRQYQVKSSVDGVEKIVSNSYNSSTGLITVQDIADYDSKGANRTMTYYKYYWEEYDATRTKNILSPVIQTKRAVYVGSTLKVLGVDAVVWKLWGTTPAPLKTYAWKRTGAFDFTAWTDTTEPTADWVKTSELKRDLTGNVIEVTSR